MFNKMKFLIRIENQLFRIEDDNIDSLFTKIKNALEEDLLDGPETKFNNICDVLRIDKSIIGKQINFDSYLYGLSNYRLNESHKFCGKFFKFRDWGLRTRDEELPPAHTKMDKFLRKTKLKIFDPEVAVCEYEMNSSLYKKCDCKNECIDYIDDFREKYHRYEIYESDIKLRFLLNILCDDIFKKVAYSPYLYKKEIAKFKRLNLGVEFLMHKFEDMNKLIIDYYQRYPELYKQDFNYGSFMDIYIEDEIKEISEKKKEKYPECFFKRNIFTLYEELNNPSLY